MHLDNFKNNFFDLIQVDKSLANFTWFGVGGLAEILVIPNTISDLKNLLNEKPKELALFAMGAGSNLLVRDKGIKGITLITRKLKNIFIDSQGIITAEAGAMDADVARFARNYERTGLEFLLGIPGSIGGGIKMNSGAFGSEFKDVLIDVDAINHKGDLRRFSSHELGMKYRGTELDNNWIFYSARFKSKPSKKKVIEDKMKSVINFRKNSQPVGVKTGGSTFKNPVGLKAWQLIDEAGCRGIRKGGAMISEKHCNFIINFKNSNAQEIEELGNYVKNKVLDTSGINLSWEIQKVGTK